MQPNNQNPYDFIMNDPPKKKGGFGLGGFSGKQRILAIIIAVGVGLIAVLLLFNLIFGGSTNTTTEMISLAQEQTELIRIAEVGVEKARTSEAKNLAITASLSVSSSRVKVLDILAKQRKKLKTKQLELKKSDETDKLLETAALNNRFDEQFIKVMDDSLTKYQNHLRQIYDMSRSKTEKEVLTDAFNGAKILIVNKQEDQS